MSVYRCCNGVDCTCKGELQGEHDLLDFSLRWEACEHEGIDDGFWNVVLEDGEEPFNGTFLESIHKGWLRIRKTADIVGCFNPNDGMVTLLVKHTTSFIRFNLQDVDSMLYLEMMQHCEDKLEEEALDYREC